MSDQFWLTKAQLKRIESRFPKSRGVPRADHGRSRVAHDTTSNTASREYTRHETDGFSVIISVNRMHGNPSAEINAHLKNARMFSVFLCLLLPLTAPKEEGQYGRARRTRADLGCRCP